MNEITVTTKFATSDNVQVRYQKFEGLKSCEEIKVIGKLAHVRHWRHLFVTAGFEIVQYIPDYDDYTGEVWARFNANQ